MPWGVVTHAPPFREIPTVLFTLSWWIARKYHVAVETALPHWAVSRARPHVSTSRKLVILGRAVCAERLDAMGWAMVRAV